jgi:8-oxo-dGTP pyrophosphatase MutT (NUDIX family)
MKYIAFEKSVGGVVYRKQDGNILFLLVRYRSGQWDFPKGHMETGESEEQTLRREIREETGLEDIAILSGFRDAVRYFYSAWGNEKQERESLGKGVYIFKKAVFYAVETQIEEVKIDFENKDYVWLSYEQAYEHISNAGSRKVLQAAQKAIAK